MRFVIGNMGSMLNVRRRPLAVALCAVVAAADDVRAALCFAVGDTAAGTWRELIPAPNAQGRVQGRDGRWWRMSDPAAVAGRFDLPLPVDVNHASELAAPRGAASPSQGWIEALEVRDGAVWGRIEWNDAGRNAVDAKQYRFLSPVFKFDPKTREIQQLTSVALVNEPNFPLALNRAGDSAVQQEKPAVDEAIRKALGLPEQATPTEAVTAINALRSSVEAPPMDKFVPRAQYDTAINRAQTSEDALRKIETARQQAAIDAEVDGAVKAGKITPATTDYYKAQCATEGGLERFKAFVAAQPVIADVTNLANRNANEGDGKSLNAATKTVAALMGVSADDIKKFGGDA